MTIDSAYSPEIFAKRDTLAYKFTHEVISETHIEVYAIDADGDYTLLDSGLYTVTLNDYIAPISAGGIVEFLAALDDTVVSISINRKTAITDEQDFVSGTAFNAESFEFQADKLTLILQEINAQVCDCSDTPPPTPPPIPPPVSEAALLYSSTTEFNGYHDSYGMVVTNGNPESLVILINTKGYANLAYSHDDGDTFTEVLAGDGATTNYPITSIKYDSVQDRFWALKQRTDTKANRVCYSNDAGISYTWRGGSDLTTEGEFGNYSMLIDGAANVFHMGNNRRLCLWSPSTINSVTPNTSIATGYGDSAPWCFLDVGGGKIYCGHGAKYSTPTANTPKDGIIYNKTLSGGTTRYTSRFTNSILAATRGTGTVLVYRSLSGSVATFNTLTVGDSTATALPTIAVDFGVDVTAVTFCYSAGPDMYIVAARDLVDASKIYLRYCEGDDFSTWHEIAQLTLPTTMDTSLNRQLYWSHDNVWYFAHQELISGSLYMRLVQINLVFPE